MASLGYILTAKIDNAYIGGLMVTDDRGIPLEFKYTEPIRPTKIQRVLYGNVLERYIKEEVVAQNLLEHVEQKPDIMITTDDDLLGLADILRIPFVQLSDTRVSALESVGDVQETKEGEFLLQVNPSASPIKIRLAKESKARDQVVKILLETGARMDLLEPMNRIEGALALISAENEVQ
ncbi:MAG: hypothetical protein ACUVXI_04890 [bacterium]